MGGNLRTKPSRDFTKLFNLIHSHCSGRFISHLFSILEIFKFPPFFFHVLIFTTAYTSWEYRIHLYSPWSLPIKLAVPSLPLSLNGGPHSTDCNFCPSENLPREYWLRNGLLRNMGNIVQLWGPWSIFPPPPPRIKYACFIIRSCDPFWRKILEFFGGMT